MSELELHIRRMCWWMTALCKIHASFDGRLGFKIAERLVDCEMLLFQIYDWYQWRQINKDDREQERQAEEMV